jgi:hypothetical protein
MSGDERVSPLQSEKDLRAFLKKNALLLKSLNLSDAMRAAVEFRDMSLDTYKVLTTEGDGLAFDAHLGTPDRGTRFEIAICRLFRLAPEDETAYRWPAVRLKLRLQYKLDKAVVEYLARNHVYGVGQSFVTWSRASRDDFLRQVEASDSFKTFSLIPPTEVRLSIDEWQYNRHNPMPSPEKEPWWGIFDVV